MDIFMAVIVIILGGISGAAISSAISMAAESRWLRHALNLIRRSK